MKNNFNEKLDVFMMIISGLFAAYNIHNLCNISAGVL